jgi:hypothetical protein
MRTFEVITRPLRRNGITYPVGCNIRIDAANADVLLQLDRIKEVKKAVTQTIKKTAARKTAAKK